MQECPANPFIKYDLAKVYPVLIITHARLKMMRFDNVGLGKIIEWDGGKREMMFIDEKPELIDNREISLEVLRQINMEAKEKKCRVKKIANSTNKRKSMRKRKIFENDLLLGTSYLLKSFDEGKSHIPPMKKKIKLSGHFGSIDKTIEKICNSGCAITEQSNSVLFKMHKYKPFSQRLVKKIIILDGTAEHDPIYKLMNIPVVKFPSRNTVMRLHCLPGMKFKTSFSKWMKEKPEIFKEIIERIQDEHPDDDLLIFTQKRFRKKIAEYATDRKLVGTYGNLKGKNSMRTKKALYMTHIFQKPPSHYICIALASGYKPSTYEYEKKKYDGLTWGFKDPKLDEIRIASLITDFIQDTYRTRIRSGLDVDIYLAVSDFKFLYELYSKYPNIEIAYKDFTT